MDGTSLSYFRISGVLLGVGDTYLFHIFNGKSGESPTLVRDQRLSVTGQGVTGDDHEVQVGRTPLSYHNPRGDLTFRSSLGLNDPMGSVD